MNHFSRVKQRDAEIDTSAATADRAVSHEDEVTEFVTTKDSECLYLHLYRSAL